MIKGDEVRFTAAMKVISDLYGKEPLSKEALRIFFMLLRKFSINQVEKALQEHISVSPYMPKPCDVISRIEGTAEERSIAAWPLVVGAVRHIGHHNSVAFPAPAYIYALKQMGGWVGICLSLRDDELKWRGKEFERFFLIGDRLASWDYEPGKIHVERYCVGALEIKNKRERTVLPDIIDARTCLPIAGFRELEPGLVTDNQIDPQLNIIVSEKIAS